MTSSAWRRGFGPLAGGLLVLVGAAGCDALRSLSAPTTPAPVPASAVRYTALGASDAIGYGGTIVCLPFAPCPDGTGYVQTVTRRLKAAHADFDATNLGIPGAVLSRRLQDLGRSAGLDIFANLTDAQVPFVPRTSTLVTVFTGGNDANTVAAAARAGRAGSDLDGFLTAQVAAFGEDFRALVAGVRARAAGARVIVLNLPNLARLPYTSGLSPTERDWFRRLAVGFSAQINATRSAEVLIIDLLCHAPIYDSQIYSSDGFHPNDLGYARLADLVMAALASPPGAPSSGCGFMN